MSDDHTLPALDTPRAAHAIPSVEPVPVVDSTVRLRRMVDGHYDAVWRTVRFLGVPDASAEDVAQQVFCVAARKLDQIAPGAELAFLLSAAWRVASEHRRAARRRPVASEGDVDELAVPLPSPEQLLDQKRARAILQEVLDAMPADLRMVFVLYEIEELTLPEISAATGVRLATATSRLRRAREEFESIVKRKNAAAGRLRGGNK
ncbi:MAG: RNA polymerase sigma factor [Polyangiaceae bacterium]|jgi:RNA polymerase sigma-70 factor, ECF subfamily